MEKCSFHGECPFSGSGCEKSQEKNCPEAKDKKRLLTDNGSTKGGKDEKNN